MQATEYMPYKAENALSTRLQCVLLELPEQPIINDMHKTNTQF